MTVIEKRSEDDRPSSFLSSEIRPGSDECPDWSLRGGSDPEIHRTSRFKHVKRM